MKQTESLEGTTKSAIEVSDGIQKTNLRELSGMILVPGRFFTQSRADMEGRFPHDPLNPDILMLETVKAISYLVVGSTIGEYLINYYVH